MSTVKSGDENRAPDRMEKWQFESVGLEKPVGTELDWRSQWERERSNFGQIGLALQVCYMCVCVMSTHEHLQVMSPKALKSP